MEQKKIAAEKKGTTFDEAIRRLEKHPFLLYSVAGLFALICSLPADKEKIESFKYLLHFVIGIPIIMQFYIEILKIKSSKGSYSNQTINQESSQTKRPSISQKVKDAVDSLFEFVGGILLILFFLFIFSKCDIEPNKNTQENGLNGTSAIEESIPKPSE